MALDALAQYLASFDDGEAIPMRERAFETVS
jgi:hypothetical protein